MMRKRENVKESDKDLKEILWVLVKKRVGIRERTRERERERE